MAVSQSDMPHFSGKTTHRSKCDPATNEMSATNVNASSWSREIKSTQDTLWPRFPPNGLPPAPGTEGDGWSSYPRTERDLSSVTTLGDGDKKTVVPSIQSMDTPTSSELTPPPPSFQRTVAECKPLDSVRISRHSVPLGTRSPTVGGESRSCRNDNLTGRSLEHLTVMHDTGQFDRTSFPAIFSKTFGTSCIGDINDALPSKRAVSAYYGVHTSVKTQQAAPIPSSLVTVNEERCLHQPDGADHPDEHMWFYEDPQGRTQGSFSDAQMHDWLSEGIYFTEGLRVRRKCDDTFSTLAQYCQLFGRIPFHSGPRIPPINGGITPHTLVTVGQMERFCPSTQARVGATNGPVVSFASSLAQASGGHRNPYKLEHESDVHLNSRSGFGSNTSEEDRSTVGKLPSGLYFNNSSPMVPNRFPSFPQARPAQVPHDLPSQGSSSLSPSFLSALAPYLAPLPSQATVTVGTSVSPPAPATSTASVSHMQQLAEIAQLAAQLAAKASEHSPDQTPMQPSQALALAEILISTHLSPTNWASQLKKESSFSTPGEFRTEQAGAATTTSGNDGLRAHAGRHSLGSYGDHELTSVQSSLVTGSSSGALLDTSDNRVSLDGDGKVTKATRETTSNAYIKQERSTEVPRNNRSGHSLKSQQNKASCCNNVGSPLPSGDVNHTGVPAPSGYTRREGQMSFADSLQRAPFPHSTTKRLAGGDSSTLDHQAKSKSHASGQVTGPESETKKRTSNKAAGKDDRHTAHSAVNGPCRIDSFKSTANQSKSEPIATAQAQCAADKVQSPVKSQTNQSDSSEAVPSVHTMKQLSEAAAVELGLLTQWSIGRLSSLPMREKVDIPTVVELLATLDAPYEVERMVSAFLGESSRATQFVKDFLDHRRPFWKLHRQLRENSIVVGQPATVNTASITADHVNCDSPAHQNTTAGSTTCRSGDRANSTVNSKKKKRPGAGSGVLPTGSISANHVLHHQSSGAGGEYSADNQWHHIKPKSSLNRKANKGGDRKIPS